MANSMMKTVKKNLYSSMACTNKKTSLIGRHKQPKSSMLPGVKILYEDEQIYEQIPDLIIPMEVDNDC